MIRELKIGDRTLQLETNPINVSIERAAAWFNKGHAVFVTLEPGDATRYDLLLVQHVSPYGFIRSWGTSQVVTVIRYSGGHAIEADNFKWPYSGPWDLDNLGGKNAWTRALIDWWLTEFAKVAKTKSQHDADSANTALTNVVRDLKEGESITP